MANVLCKPWKAKIMQGTAAALLNGSGTTGVYAALIDTGVHTVSDATEFYSTGGSNDFVDGVVGTPVEITSKTFTNAIFDGADVNFSSVTGSSTEAIGIFVKNAGADTTWCVVGYFDTGVTGLPATPNGGNIVITWNASGIFQL